MGSASECAMKCRYNERAGTLWCRKTTTKARLVPAAGEQSCPAGGSPGSVRAKCCLPRAAAGGRDGAWGEPELPGTQAAGKGLLAQVALHRCLHEAVAGMGHVPEAAVAQGKPPPSHFILHSWCNSTAPANLGVCFTVGVWAGAAWPCVTLCCHGLSVLGCSVPFRGLPGDTQSANPQWAGGVNPAPRPCNPGFMRAAAGLSWSCCLGLFSPSL